MKWISILLISLAVSGCIKEELEECLAGNVRVNIYVERFQTKPSDGISSREAAFNKRIEHLRYLLYKEGKLHSDGVLADVLQCRDSAYVFRLQGLEWGNYQLIMAANSEKVLLAGDPDKLIMAYPGVEKGIDYLTFSLPFTVDCNCEMQYTACLSRMHGVVRYLFEGVPDDINALEMRMTHLCNQYCIGSNYDGDCEVVKRVELDKLLPLKSTNKEKPNRLNVVVGAFPTATGQRSAYYLSLYKDSDSSPWYEEMVTDTLTVQRNQLLEILTRFDAGAPSFEVHVDTRWDGAIDGGWVEVN